MKNQIALACALSCASFLFGCCTHNAVSLPSTVTDKKVSIAPTEVPTEMFGYPDKAALVNALETEIARRALKEKLTKLGMPSDVALNDRFADRTTDRLIQIQSILEVYGPDDRVDPVLMTRSSNLDRNIRSTAAVFYDFQLVPPTASTPWRLKDPDRKLLGDWVCKDQRFVDQPAIAVCTAFLIDRDVVATAKHCASSTPDVQGKLFVFDYALKSDGTVRTEFTTDEVFRGKEWLGGAEVPFGQDWALVRLDGTPTGRDPLPLRASGDVPDNEPVYIIGYPSGLPVKFAGNAKVVINNVALDYFVSNVDGFGGNSGSPVVSANTDVVEGILGWGDIDYFPVGDCQKPKACPDDTHGCRGESATRIKLVKYKP